MLRMLPLPLCLLLFSHVSYFEVYGELQEVQARGFLIITTKTHQGNLPFPFPAQRIDVRIRFSPLCMSCIAVYVY